MSTITLTPQDVVRTGLAATYLDSGASPKLNVTDTFTFNNTGKEILHFKKSGAGSCDVTFTTPGTVDGLAVADRVVAIPATTGDKFIGPLLPSVYNTPGGSTLNGFTVSEVTGLTLAIIRLP